jgi:hypothetical protein
MQVQQDFIIIVHQVLIQLIPRSPILNTYLISLSLGDKDDSRSYIASTAQAGNQHETQGKIEMTPLFNQVKRRSWEYPYPRTRLYV